MFALKTTTITAALGGLMMFAAAAHAADLPVPMTEAPPPPVVQAPQNDCVYAEVQLHNWDKLAVFRVSAKGGKVPNGFLQMPARLAPGETRLCLPRALLEADAIEICIGDTSRDKSNSRLIQNQWMVMARQNAAATGVINPGRPMHFRFNGDASWQQQRPRPQAMHMAPPRIVQPRPVYYAPPRHYAPRRWCNGRPCHYRQRQMTPMQFVQRIVRFVQRPVQQYRPRVVMPPRHYYGYRPMYRHPAYRPAPRYHTYRPMHRYSHRYNPWRYQMYRPQPPRHFVRPGYPPRPI